MLKRENQGEVGQQKHDACGIDKFFECNITLHRARHWMGSNAVPETEKGNAYLE
jgi:hypothetical protein